MRLNPAGLEAAANTFISTDKGEAAHCLWQHRISRTQTSAAPQIAAHSYQILQAILGSSWIPLKPMPGLHTSKTSAYEESDQPTKNPQGPHTASPFPTPPPGFNCPSNLLFSRKHSPGGALVLWGPSWMLLGLFIQFSEWQGLTLGHWE